MPGGWAAGLREKGWMVAMPFSVVCSGVMARASDVEFDDRRFLFGMSGDVLCDFPEPLVVFGLFWASFGWRSPSSNT